MQKILLRINFAFLLLVSIVNCYGQTPVPMASQTGLTYTENFSDIANWTANFAAGTGASAFRSVAVTATGTVPDGVKTTTSTATFSTSTSAGVQKGTGAMVLLAINSSDNTTAIAVDFLVNFTGVSAGTLSFDWAAIANSTGNRASTLNVYTSSDDGANFTQLALPAGPTNIANNSGSTGSVSAVQLPAGLNNAAHAVIRFYLYNGTGGTTGSRPKISVDNLTVTATSNSTPPPSDTTPPVTTASYPKTGNITSATVDLTNNLSEAGTTYYVVLPSPATAPTPAQVKAGQDATGAAATTTGSFAVAAATDAVTTISGLTASTVYTIYTVSQDAAGNLQTAIGASVVTTAAPTLANVSGYPKTANIVTTSADLLSDLNVNGTTYYVVLPTTATAPTAAQVLAGQDGSGAAVSLSGSFAVTANTAATKTITGLTSATGYKIYVASQNTAATSTTTLSTLSATTAIQYFASYPFTGVTLPNASAVPPIAGSGLTDPTPVPTATGITFGSFTAHNSNVTQPNAGSRFSFTNWPLGAMNASDSFAATIDTTQYYTVTITPQTNKLTLTAINFTIQRSGTGVRQYAVRSSLDNFANNLQASVDPSAVSALSVVSGNIFQITDATTTATPGNIITLNSSYTDLTAPVTFHFYGFNAEAIGGTFSIDDVNLSGSAGGPIPVASAPVNAAGYPKTSNITTTAVTLTNNLNEAGKTYFVVLPSTATAPTAAQVKAGQNASGTAIAAPLSGSFAVTANTDANTAISGLAQATAYTIYTVSQDNAATPNLQASAVATAVTTLGDTPKTDQHITFAATATATYGSADIDPAATSDNNTITITYTSGDVTVATIANNKVHILKAGTVIITANQAGNDSFDPAAAQQETLTIQPKAITVTANAATKTYGNTDPAFTYQTTGTLVGTDAFTGTLSRTAGELVNNYAITQGNLALNSNYSIIYTGANLSITPKALTITADNQTRVYGVANPAFTITYVGFVNGDTQASLTTPATATTTANATSALGSYDIIPAGAVSTNYTFNYVNGTLTIVSNSRTLTFTSLPSKTYGDADFDANATLSNGETPLYTTSDASVATIVNGKVHIVAAGNVNIIASSPVNPDYVTTQPVTQLLVINKANQTITFASIPGQLEGTTYSLAAVTASSGLPVTFTTDDPFVAKVSGTTLSSLTLGTATITATVASNGNYNTATASQQVKIADVNGNELIVHRAVSPNGDGINEFLYIEGIQDHPVNRVTIVNGTGVKVYEVNNYSNTNSGTVFNGRSNVNGKLQLAGTYFYVIELNDGGKVHRQTGYFLLKY